MTDFNYLTLYRCNRRRRKSEFSTLLSNFLFATVTGLSIASGNFAYSAEQELLSNTELDSRDGQYQLIMQRANRALMHRDISQALLLYDQAATQFGERPEAELAKVRAHLLGGSFREALAFANLIVGEHADFPPAIALLAFIEDRSGHMERAIARLETALKQWPDSQSLRSALAEILIDRGSVAKAISLLDEWIGRNSADADILRMRARATLRTGDRQAVIDWRSRVANKYTEASSEYTSEDWPPPAFEKWPSANVDPNNVSNGVVIDAGRRVITTTALAARDGDHAYVRNGLGQMRKAMVESRDEVTGLAVLLLDAPYEAQSSITPAAIKTAKPGSFCFVLGFPVVGDIDGNYPVLSQGIVVRTRLGSAELTQITAWLSTDQRGAPLFDSAGNLIGIYRGTGDQIEAARRDGLGNGNFAVGSDAIIARATELSTPQTPPRTIATALSTDELYERLLPDVVSIMVTQ